MRVFSIETHTACSGTQRHGSGEQNGCPSTRWVLCLTVVFNSDARMFCSHPEIRRPSLDLVVSFHEERFVCFLFVQP